MALAIDSIEASGLAHSSAGATTLTYAFTNTAGTVLYVRAVATSSGGVVSITGVTYNGIALTPIASTALSFDGGQTKIQIFRILAAAGTITGTHNVVITGTLAGSGANNVLGSAISFTGNDPTTPDLNGATGTAGTGSHATVAVTGTTAGNIILDGIATGSGVTSSDKTIDAKLNVNTNTAGNNTAGSTAAAGGSITMGYTVTSDQWGIVGLEIAAAAGGGGSRGLFRTPPVNGMGVGGSFFRDPLSAPRQMVRRDRIFVPASVGAAA